MSVEEVNIKKGQGKVWPSPAKINLFLHITGKRDDGYHLLQTIFQFLDYGDDLFFDLRDDQQIIRDYDYGFSKDVDLCVRAAKKLQAIKLQALELQGRSTQAMGINIGLHKRLPMGGGLGGGSSNAATTLIALNELWNVGLNRDQLAEIGLQLGADVPVFVKGQSAWAEGVGEVLTPIELPEKWFLVVIPQVSVSTAQVFANKHLTPRPEMKKIRAFQEGCGENQLEEIVRAEYPEVNAVLEWLSHYGEPRMSGSGGCVYLSVKNRQQGLDILTKKALKSTTAKVTGFVTKAMNQHPLFKG